MAADKTGNQLGLQQAENRTQMTMDNKKKEIKRFHVLLMQCGITENGKEGILSAYGVESSKDLSVAALIEINNRLQAEVDKLHPKPEAEKDTRLEDWRRRCKKATGMYLAAKGDIPADGWGLAEWNKIQGTICRAAKAERFYDIPLSTLRGITYEFNKQRQAMEDVADYVRKTGKIDPKAL